MQFSFYSYSRPLEKPLHTAYGTWYERSGIILRLETHEGIGFGEIAPLPPHFGTETFTDALTFCKAHAHMKLDWEMLMPKLKNLPCCQSALEMAYQMATERLHPKAKDLPVCALLPAGSAALDTLPKQLQQGFKTFKWKIGVCPIAEEIEICKALLEHFTDGQKLRLDANGELNSITYTQWSKALQDYAMHIDYLEQPLAVGEESMLYTQDQSPISLALDESILTFECIQKIHTNGFNGRYVIKPACVGHLRGLNAWLSQATQSYLNQHIVFSSCFETSIGIQHILSLAAQYTPSTPLGLGTLAYFAQDAFSLHTLGPYITYNPNQTESLCQSIWNFLRSTG